MSVDYSISGPVMQVAWDYGVRIPLWDAEGLLPEEPEWLRKALGLSDPLIYAFIRWGFDMNEIDATPRPTAMRESAALSVRGRQLAHWLQQEVGPVFIADGAPRNTWWESHRVAV